jgi:excisionase family DNA binding protein
MTNPTQSLTIEEAMHSLRTSRAAVYRIINSGDLRTFKIGRRRYTTPQAIADFIKARERLNAA